MGRFSNGIGKSQYVMNMNIGRPSIKGQHNGRSLGKLQHRLELGETVLVQQLEMFKQPI